MHDNARKLNMHYCLVELLLCPDQLNYSSRVFQPIIITWIFEGVFGVYQVASNHEELHNLMKVTVMIHRFKKDVLSQLPMKRRQQLEMLKAKLKSAQSKEEAESLKFTQKNLINRIYTDSAEAKIPSVLDYLGTIIEVDCKFLIFAHQQPMIDSIHEFLLKKKVGCIRIDGSTPVASRKQLVTEFQEKKAIKTQLQETIENDDGNNDEAFQAVFGKEHSGAVHLGRNTQEQCTVMGEMSHRLL